MLEHGYKFELPTEEELPIIKVIGVGGGGSNAVNHMFRLGVKDVDFIVCNTDRQALTNSPVPSKLQLGAHLTKGLGAGTDPKVGREAALENIDDIRLYLGEPTQMVFITAGMGGGTGTGAAPIISQIAKEMGLLTIAVVTAPFKFEGKEKRLQAMEGIDGLKAHCDTVLVVLNDKLAEIHGDLPIRKAFAHADNVLANAVKSIAEMITVRGEINVDFMDVKRVLEGAGQAVMGSFEADGSDRSLQAIEQALNSPLLNDRDIRGAKRILLTMASSSEYETTMNEQLIITSFIEDKIGKEAWLFKHGAIIDESLGKKLRVTVIAAGFDLVDDKDFNPKPDPVPEPEPEPEIPEAELQEEELVGAHEDSPNIFSETQGGHTPTGVPGVSYISDPYSTSEEMLLIEEREDDPMQLQRMIQEFVANRYNERELEPPAYTRQKIVLYDMPMIPDHEFSRSRLND
ncbi:cell division protein FtsZ [Tellurirhabdus bombi]|uniref:cell division protein FtsZ n=1 Tax=Tellurirhabdus bombi TaxID=2907205 RepID=UPI001F176C46|nr:cell division protein FtsZ [Tellurirhabdus bombi]